MALQRNDRRHQRTNDVNPPPSHALNDPRAPQRTSTRPSLIIYPDDGRLSFAGSRHSAHATSHNGVFGQFFGIKFLSVNYYYTSWLQLIDGDIFRKSKLSLRIRPNQNGIYSIREILTKRGLCQNGMQLITLRIIFIINRSMTCVLSVHVIEKRIFQSIKLIVGCKLTFHKVSTLYQRNRSIVKLKHVWLPK